MVIIAAAGFQPRSGVTVRPSFCSIFALIYMQTALLLAFLCLPELRLTPWPAVGGEKILLPGPKLA
jgi:hypothetical protein